MFFHEYCWFFHCPFNTPSSNYKVIDMKLPFGQWLIIPRFNQESFLWIRIKLLVDNHNNHIHLCHILLHSYFLTLNEVSGHGQILLILFDKSLIVLYMVTSIKNNADICQVSYFVGQVFLLVIKKTNSWLSKFWRNIMIVIYPCSLFSLNCVD